MVFVWIWEEVLKAAMRPKFVVKNPQLFLANLNVIEFNKKIKYIRSDFWRDVFKMIGPLMSKYNSIYKHTIASTNIWGCPSIKNQNRMPLDPAEFHHNVTKITQISDLLKT